jgi:hypothetical protein
MAFNYAKLAEAELLDSSGVTIFTNPVSTTTYIRSIILHNVNTIVETVSLYNVPDSTGSAGTLSDTTNRIYKEELEAGDTRILEFPTPGLVLTDANDTIQGLCTVNNKVIVYMYGGQE